MLLPEITMGFLINDIRGIGDSCCDGSRQMVTVQKPVKEALYHDKKPIHAHA